jgi:hypothetical protein
VPVSGMSDLESYVKDKVINGHCDCMFLYNTYQWDWTTIAALVAPRPLLFANSDNDKIFPMDGNRRIIARLRQLYKLYDKPELVDDYVSKGGHAYRADLRVAVFQWLNKHLKNDTAKVKDADFPPIDGKELRVFPENSDLPRDAINNKIDESFVRLAQVDLPEEGKFEAWKKGLLDKLREKSFRTFPERVPKAESVVEDIRDTAPTRDRLKTEAGIEIGLWEGFKESKHKAKEGVLVVLDAGVKVKEGLPRAEATFAGQARIFAIQLHEARHNTTAHKDPPNYVPRAHALLGRSADQGSVWDIAATVRHLADTEKEVTSWKVIGRGQAGILAAYAALFEPAIKEVVVIDPPPSHDQGPIFLNVLRVLDIPEALGLLAPTPLTIVNADKKLSSRVADIYALAGAKDQLHRKQAAFR